MVSYFAWTIIFVVYDNHVKTKVIYYGKSKQLYKTMVVNVCINAALLKFYINL